MQLRDFNSKEAVQRALDEGDEELASEIDDIIKSWIAIGNRRRQHAEYEDEAAQWAQTARDFKAEEIVQAIVSHFNTVGIPEEILLRYVKDKDNWSDTRGRHTFTSKNERGVSSAAFTEVASVETQLWFPLDVPDDAGVENIPDSFIQDALSEIGADAWSEPVPQIVGQEAIFGYLEGDPIDIMAENFRLEEALVDMRQEYATEHVENETDEVFDQVMTEIAATGQQLGRIEGRQEEFTLNQAKELVRRAREMWKGLERQPPLYAPPEEEITDSIKIALAQWIKGDQKAALLGLREVCDYFPEADHDLEVVGVIEFKGEKGETPWTVYNLKSQDLWAESAKMNHCVGDPEQKYGRSVKDGDILIWSVRLPSGKPMFTIEIAPNWQDWVGAEAHGSVRLTREGGLIPVDSTPVKQIKGNANREPGFSRARKLDTWMNVKGAKEIKRLAKFFYGLGLDPFLIDDMRPGMQMLVMQQKQGTKEEWETGSGTQDYFAPEHRDERLRENGARRARRRRKVIVQRGPYFIRVDEITDLLDKKNTDLEAVLDEYFPLDRIKLFVEYCEGMRAALPTKTTSSGEVQWMASNTRAALGASFRNSSIGSNRAPLRFDFYSGDEPDGLEGGSYAFMHAHGAKTVQDALQDPRWQFATDEELTSAGFGHQSIFKTNGYFIFTDRVPPWDAEYAQAGLSPDDHEEMLAHLDEYRDNPFYLDQEDLKKVFEKDIPYVMEYCKAVQKTLPAGAKAILDWFSSEVVSDGGPGHPNLMVTISPKKLNFHYTFMSKDTLEILDKEVPRGGKGETHLESATKRKFFSTFEKDSNWMWDPEVYSSDIKNRGNFVFRGRVGPWDLYAEMSPDDHEEMLAHLDEHRDNPLEDWREPLDDLSDEELEQKLITAVLHRAELARVGFPYDGIQAEIRQIRAEMLSRGHMVYPSLSPFENPDEEEKKPTLKCLWVGGPPGQTFLKIKKKLMTIKGDHFTGIEVIKQSWDAAAVSDLRKFDLIIVNQDMVGHPEYLDTKAVAKAQGVPLVMGSLSFTRTYIELQKAGFVR